MSQLDGRRPQTNPAELYERHFVPAVFAPWAQELLRRAAPQPGERVLDVACGTGIVARAVAPIVGSAGRVAALDLSPAMVAVARSRPAPPGAAIAWHEGSADALPFPDGAFDLVLCQQGLQFFPDRPAALREMRRVLAPGGRAVLSVWRSLRHNPFYEVVIEAQARHLGSPSVFAPYSLGEANELRALLDGAGFGDVTIEPATLTIRFPSREDFVHNGVLASAAVQPAFAQADEAARAALVSAVRRDVEATLRRYAEGEGLAFPMAAHIARARA